MFLNPKRENQAKSAGKTKHSIVRQAMTMKRSKADKPKTSETVPGKRQKCKIDTKDERRVTGVRYLT